jgi:predicted amidohydrolase
MMTSGTAATTVAAVQMRAMPRDVSGNLDKALGFLEEATSPARRYG